MCNGYFNNFRIRSLFLIDTVLKYELHNTLFSMTVQSKIIKWFNKNANIMIKLSRNHNIC